MRHQPTAHSPRTRGDVAGVGDVKDERGEFAARGGADQLIAVSQVADPA